MRLIDAEFEEKHYTSMLLTPTPDVTKLDQKNARIVIDALKMAPTVDAVPVRHGRWNNGYEVQNCSECGYRGKRSYKYCPNCGAKMDGGADNESLEKAQE